MRKSDMYLIGGALLLFFLVKKNASPNDAVFAPGGALDQANGNNGNMLLTDYAAQWDNSDTGLGAVRG